MALKDFSDYVVTIWGAGERVYDDIHVRMLPKPKREPEPKKFQEIILTLDDKRGDVRKEVQIPYYQRVIAFHIRGWDYLFESQRDRAYRLRKVLWPRWVKGHPFKSILEFFRSKKIGHIHYKEPYCLEKNQKGYENWMGTRAHPTYEEWEGVIERLAKEKEMKQLAEKQQKRDQGSGTKGRFGWFRKQPKPIRAAIPASGPVVRQRILRRIVVSKPTPAVESGPAVRAKGKRGRAKRKPQEASAIR